MDEGFAGFVLGLFLGVIGSAAVLTYTLSRIDRPVEHYERIMTVCETFDGLASADDYVATCRDGTRIFL